MDGFNMFIPYKAAGQSEKLTNSKTYSWIDNKVSFCIITKANRNVIIAPYGGKVATSKQSGVFALRGGVNKLHKAHKFMNMGEYMKSFRLTINAASKQYGVPTYTLRQWAKNGLVKSWRASEKGWICLDRSDLESFLKEKIGMDIPQTATTDNQSVADGPQFLLVDEAAKLLGVCRKTIYQYCLQGILPSVKLGRRRLIPVEGLKKQLVNASNVTAFPDKLDYRDVTGGVVCAQ